MSDCICTKTDCTCGCQHTEAKSECEEAANKLEDLLRDELCAEASAPIREHIKNCPDCRQEQRVCEALTEAVKRGCREKAPTQLRDAILEALNK